MDKDSYHYVNKNLPSSSRQSAFDNSTKNTNLIRSAGLFRQSCFEMELFNGNVSISLPDEEFIIHEARRKRRRIGQSPPCPRPQEIITTTLMTPPKRQSSKVEMSTSSTVAPPPLEINIVQTLANVLLDTAVNEIKKLSERKFGREKFAQAGIQRKVDDLKTALLYHFKMRPDETLDMRRLGQRRITLGDSSRENRVMRKIHDKIPWNRFNDSHVYQLGRSLSMPMQEGTLTRNLSTIRPTEKRKRSRTIITLKKTYEAMDIDDSDFV